METLLKSVDREWYRQRITWAMFCVMVAFSILIFRLFYLQIVEGQEYRRLSENQCIRIQGIPPTRGLIFDRNGILLVDNRPSFDLYITPRDARPLESTIERLSVLCQTPKEELIASITKQQNGRPYKPIRLKQDIDRDILAAVEAHRFELPGITVDIRPIRHYIYKDIAAHLMGYLGEINAEELKRRKKDYEYRPGDLIGKSGIEKSAESYLRGTRGGRLIEVDARGQMVRTLKTNNAQTGDNVYLTIDYPLQQKASELMKDLTGSIVAIEPDTGKILAMTSSPAFDPNIFVDGISHDEWDTMISDPLKPMINKAIYAEYPPASTYKVVTALAGLESGVINANSTFNCPGYYRIGEWTFRCWKRQGHGTLNVTEAISRSCDVFFYNVGLKLGVDRLARYAKACGLGSPTHIPLDHEAVGLIPTTSWKEKTIGVPWQLGETLPVSIGQGYNLVTPLQMAVLTAAIANGGTRYRPRILQCIQKSDTSDINQNADLCSETGIEVKKLGKLPVSARNLEIVRKGMCNAVNGIGGTAYNARVDGIEVCGKTGTAQVFSHRRSNISGEIPEHLKDHAWFIAYAPADHPRIAIAIIVEHGEHGSSTAAPIAKELIKTYLNL